MYEEAKYTNYYVWEVLDKLSGYRKYQEAILCTSERSSDGPITKNETCKQATANRNQGNKPLRFFKVNMAALQAQNKTYFCKYYCDSK